MVSLMAVSRSRSVVERAPHRVERLLMGAASKKCMTGATVQRFCREPRPHFVAAGAESSRITVCLSLQRGTSIEISTFLSE
jgi:hypothetical protein